MENGSLDKFLFDDDKPTLTWFQRFQIIKGVASALLYLHEEWEQVVLHRDVKASNVLLDSNLNGRLGDFGLARLYDRDGDPQTTRLVGTLGYIDPELTRTGRATKAADVFAFGAFLLEVACGRKPFEPNAPPRDIFLVGLVNRCWKRDAIVDVIDPRLQGNYVVEEIEKVLKLGLLCSNPKPDLRPTIKEAVSYLEGTASLPDIPLDNALNNPSSILQTFPLSPHSTAINVSLASNVASDCIGSFSSSVGTDLSVNSLSSTDTILHIVGSSHCNWVEITCDKVGSITNLSLTGLYDRDGDPQTTRLVGTLGYIDPELTRMGRATKAADVFAFGAFLLEVACGRKPFEPNAPPQNIFLVDLVNRCWKRDAIVDVIDPRLQGNYVVEEIEKVLKLGLLCSNPKPDLRPTIKEAVSYLEGTASLPDIPLDNAQNNPSSILQTLPLSPQSTAINVSLASNVASDCIVSFSSSVGTGLSVNSLSSTDTVLHIGR
ncbi:hypothetical protein Gotur_016960 [Gossypium turneri]